MKHLTVRQFADYFEKKLAPKAVVRLEEHVAGCKRCAVQARLLRFSLWTKSVRNAARKKRAAQFTAFFS